VSNYIIDVDTKVGGIPCLARVTHFYKCEGSYNRNAASDMDYYGYTECDWKLHDRRGRRAEWLDKKITVDDVARIEREIERALS
jgi:antirestriction protein